jgi:hypothetical protein
MRIKDWGAEVVIPSRGNRKKPPDDDWVLYKERTKWKMD